MKLFIPNIKVKKTGKLFRIISLAAGDGANEGTTTNLLILSSSD